MPAKSKKGRSSTSFGDGILPSRDSRVSRRGAARSDQKQGKRNRDHGASTKVPFPTGLPSDRPIEMDAYFQQLSIWLDLEAEAERVRLAQRRQARSRDQAERTGETILGLELIETRTGLGGRNLLDFAKPTAVGLPMNRLKVGSPVVVTFDDDPSDEGVPGVISRRTNNAIQVATDRLPERNESSTSKANKSMRGSRKRGIGQHGKGDVSGGRRRGRSNAIYRLDLSPDETTRRRQLSAMAAAQTVSGRSKRLRDVLLGERSPRFDGQSIDTDPDFQTAIDETRAEIDFRTDLNPPQRDAVAFALLADDLAVIHGPPGTGKTTTLAEVIVQAVSRGDRVLACAASNTAVDNLLERLTKLMPRVVRVGHPARVMEWLRQHTLDSLVENDRSAAVIKDLRRELDSVLRHATRLSGDRHDRRTRRELFAEAGQLRGQIRGLERSIVRGILESADVICTTTTIDDELLSDSSYDLVVIDEACQCTEPGIWQAMLRAQRVVLAGDHCQLPPTVLSDEATAIGMRESLMQRMVDCFGPPVYRRLTVQYRMHEDIMRFSSDEFYEGTLVADVSVRHHRLSDCDGVIASDVSTDVLQLIDTAGANFEEQKEADGESKWNPGEARVIINLVRELIDIGVSTSEIAIIAPYAAQVRALRGRLEDPDLEIDTVDGFQGREKDVVLLSMVRSNASGEIGFLSDQRRSNVALTRARRKCVIVGDSATLGGHDFYGRVIDYFERHGRYQSVFELIADLEP